MSLHEDLKAFLDGELEPIRAEEVKIALERDPSLRQELAELKMISAGLQHHAAEFSPRGLESTLAALAKSKAKRRDYLNIWLFGGGLAAATVIFGIVVMPSFVKKDEDAGASSETVASAAKSTSHSFDDEPSQKKALVDFDSKGYKSPASPKAKESAGRSFGRNRATVQEPAKAQSKLSRVATSDGVDLLSKPANGFIQPSGKTSAEASAKSSLTPSVVPPVTVALNFASKDEGVQQVLSVVGKYAVAQPDASKLSTDVPEQSTKTIEVELPEEDADKIISELRSLPAVSQTHKVATRQADALGPRGAASSGGFGGGLFRRSTSQAKSKSTPLPNSPAGAPGAPGNSPSKFANSLGGRPVPENSSAGALTPKPEASVNGTVTLKKPLGERAAKVDATKVDQIKKAPRKRRVLIVISEKPKQ